MHTYKKGSHKISLLLKLGTAISILPYFSHYNKWAELMTELWKASKELWSDNHTAFYGAYQLLSKEVVEKYLNEKSIVDTLEPVHINKDYTLQLDLSSYYDRKFMKNIVGYKVPNLRSIFIDYEKFFNVVEMNEFMRFSAPDKVLYLFITCSSAQPWILSYVIFPHVITEVKFDSWYLHSNTVVQIFSRFKNTRKISFINCSIEISSKTVLDNKIEYSTSELEIEWNVGRGHLDLLCNQKLFLFAQALANTTLLNSLTYISILTDIYSVDACIETFKSYGFKALSNSKSDVGKPSGSWVSNMLYKIFAS